MYGNAISRNESLMNGNAISRNESLMNWNEIADFGMGHGQEI